MDTPVRGNPVPESAFRADIEGLRGIAVLLVVLFHAGIPVLRGGFIGVDVFFVLSGYLITGLLAAEIETKGKLDLVRFYGRRARRLLPASALMLFVTVLAGLSLLAPQELLTLARTAAATALYASNVFFAWNEADYFAAGVETNPLLHTWSLAVEEQFYLVWPLLLMAGLQWRRSPKRLFGLMAALTAGSFVLSIWLTAHSANWAFYGSPARAWEFGLGGLAAMVPKGRVRWTAAGIAAMGWLGLAGILVSAAWITRQIGFPGWIAIVPCLGTAIALIAGAEASGEGVGRLLGTWPLQLFGKLSYSWYLWHWPMLVFAGAIAPWIGFGGRLLTVLAALGVAAIAHRLVENPIRFSRYLVARPALTLGLAMALTLCSTGLAYWLRRASVSMAESPALQRIAAASVDLPPLPRDRCYPSGMEADLRVCEFGDTASPVRVVLFGDSHAAQWFAPLETAAKENHWRLVTMLKSGCPAADVYFTHPKLGRTFADGCQSWRAQARESIAAMRPDLVILGNSGVYVLAAEKSEEASISLDEWRAATRRTLSGFAAAGIPVLQMRDTPAARFDVPTCLARIARLSWYPKNGCTVDGGVALRADVFEAERNAARGLASVRFADLSAALCDRARCEPLKDNLVVYRDSNHMTAKFARTLAPALAIEVRSALRR